MKPEDYVRELIGSQALTIATLRSQLDAHEARIRELEIQLQAKQKLTLVDKPPEEPSSP